MLDRLFVYGTLQPGRRLWPSIEEFVSRTERAKITGFRLYHLPEGYPAIEPGDGEVFGRLLHFDAERAARAVEVTDRLEGFVEGDPSSPYERIIVEVEQTRAYTYVYHPNRRRYLRRRGKHIPGGDWLERVGGK